LIHIKKPVIDDNQLHNTIISEIILLTGKNIPITVSSLGGKLIEIKVNDNNLSATKKTALKNYLDTL